MMETTIPCRNCDHPLKSGSCLGCNMFRLYEALQRGKLNWAKDEHNGIVESKLEQPTLSPDDLRGVGKWIKNNDGVCWWWECSECHELPLQRYGYDKLTAYCPYCGSKMKGE